MAPYSAGVPQDDALPRICHVEATKQASYSLQASFEILKKYGSQVKRLRSGKQDDPSLEMEKLKGLSKETGSSRANRRVLSSTSIMTMARKELFQSKAPKKPDFTSRPPNACKFDSCAGSEQIKHMKRAMDLLDAAEKFWNQQYDTAEKLLIHILSVSYADHPVERVITRFAHDLRERIDIVSNKLDLEREVVFVDLEQAVAGMRSAIHSCEQRLPFTQISHFTGIQIILDHAESAERIHFIDIGIKLGSHWIVILHALANRKSHLLKQLKITVVCTPKDRVEETGKLLTSFAEYMNLPFVFKILLYSEMYELEKDQFEIEAGEFVAVYLEFCLISLSESPQKLEALIRRVMSLSPHLMVVSELEVNTSGSTFIDRFVEALFICCAMFDCIDRCLERDNQFREIFEKVYFQEIISKGVMSEDEGSLRRHCKIEFWREYFRRFGIVETELTDLSIYQAELMIRESPFWDCCTLTLNGKCMVLGWDAVPLRTVSAWKFQHD